MRIVHTADWHLGHTLYQYPRAHEHRRFLEWLLAVLGEHRVDVLLIAGDVFETANPPATALEAWYRFLAEACARHPRLSVVVIGGNHDSAARLDAPRALLEALRVRVVGGLPRAAGGAIDLDRAVVPLAEASGEVAAQVAAVPYLRPTDLPRVEGGADELVEGVRAVYAEVLEAARRRLGSGQALLAMGHCYLSGGALSELSERKVLGGNQHALPADLFPGDLSYVALGHLHLAQTVGRPEIRYPGSPLPLSLAERDYRHQVLLVELDGARLHRVRPLEVPRAVEILRVPPLGELPAAGLAAALGALPARAGRPEEAWPYLEVRVRLDGPRPGLRQEVEALLEGRAVRLASVSASYGGSGAALPEAVPRASLDELGVEEVFRLLWARQHEGEPPEALLGALHELVDQVGQEDAA
ncbi:MAG: exonuclease SbcCD subunit D C-terminal domain-containing protein [Planctomycetes bacterium]|nr:exonuclease SbcCD subunit D C-terminal domain-containing protein [Planctomycetota bacterium]